MKKNLFILIALCNAFAVYAQPAAGLVAHWDMNGTVNDVSGGGHNGNANNITAAVGEGGLPNTAYYFNGLNSYVTVPYSPDLNINTFTISAIVKITGFYTGECQANMILNRGSFLTSGSYAAYFVDNPFDSSCTHTDTTKDVFESTASTTNEFYASWQYEPTIMENIWYNVVFTYDDTTYKVYVNDTLKSAAYRITPWAAYIPTTDSLAIGFNIYDSPTFPYPFKGYIDDIRLYDRALTDSEVVHLYDTCGTITIQPVNSTVHEGGTSVYTVHSTITGVTYQWQQNSGSGFVNLSNAGPYSGVTTNTLTVTGVTPAMSSYMYRCLLSNSWGCKDTTSSAVQMISAGVGNVINSDFLSVYPNPATTYLTIASQSPISQISISNLLGQTVYSNKYSSPQVQIDISSLPSGLYFVKVNGSMVRKFVKK